MIDFGIDKELHALFFNFLYEELGSMDKPTRLFSITKKLMSRGGHNSEIGKWEVLKVDSYAIHYSSYCMNTLKVNHLTRYIYDDSDIWSELDTMYKNIIIDKRDKIINDVLL